MGSSAVVFHVNDPTLLETFAVWEALALAEDSGVQHLHVASFIFILRGTARE